MNDRLQIINNKTNNTFLSNTQKTIAIVANTTWNIRNFRLNVIRTLIKKGFRVVVIAPIDDYISYLEEYPEVKHYNLPKLSRKGKNPFLDIQLFWVLVKMYRKINPDFILHYTIKPNIYGSLAARLCRIPTGSAVTGLGYPFIHNGRLGLLVRKLYLIAFKKNKFILFENSDDLRFFNEQKIIRQKQGISTKGCGVDVDYFSPISELSTSPQITFSFIGRLLYDKGISEFIEAAGILKNKYPHFKFQVIGELDEGNPASANKKELLEWVEKKVIIYRGFHSDIREIIDKSHCIVLPSYREGFSRVLMEAMSMARPIITTDTPGCRDAVEEGSNGYLVKTESTNDLAIAMQKFALLSFEKKREMGLKGRAKAQREFDDEVIAEIITNRILKEIPNLNEELKLLNQS